MSSPTPGGSPEQPAAGQVDAGAPSPAPEFLSSLIDAMLRVVEASRAGTLAELRAASDGEMAQLDARRAERDVALREQSKSELNEIGVWERSEIERIRSEALSKVAARRGQLDHELAELASTSDAERAALSARPDAYERETALFMEELTGIRDPAAFAAAAARMPAPPPHPLGTATQSPVAPTADAGHDAAPANPEKTAPTPLRPEPVPVEWTEPSLAARLAALNQQLGREPVTAEADGVGATTSIEVSGLGSFGAITSFKQSLARVSGIHSVALALGPTGDFVYTAIHPTGFDVAGAIRTIEGEDVQIERQNGTLRVKVARGRA